MAVYSSVLDLIGNTPIVDVSQLSPNPKVRILAKLEGQNPAGSVKDRIALAMVRAADADPVASEVSYELPNTADTARKCRRAAAETEGRCAEVYAALLPTPG